MSVLRHGEQQVNYQGLSDHEREQFNKVAIEHLGNELITLMDLRSRLVYARTLLCRGADRSAVIAVLNGEPIPEVALDDARNV